MNKIYIRVQFVWIIFENRMYFIENHNAIVLNNAFKPILFLISIVCLASSSSCLWFFWFKRYAFIGLETNRICCLRRKLITTLEKPTPVHHSKKFRISHSVVP